MIISHPEMFKKRFHRDKLQWPTSAVSNFNFHINCKETALKLKHQYNEII